MKGFLEDGMAAHDGMGIGMVKRMCMKPLVGAILLNVSLCASLAMPGTATLAATVERFSPQGEIRSVRQVAVRFSEDMVKFGDPKAAAPFAIDCSETGQGRWLDSRA